jgi:hypothetical protein
MDRWKACYKPRQLGFKPNAVREVWIEESESVERAGWSGGETVAAVAVT